MNYRSLLYLAIFFLTFSCATANTQSSTSNAAVATKIIPQAGINGAWLLTMSNADGQYQNRFYREN